jgi:hypothetical protein
MNRERLVHLLKLAGAPNPEELAAREIENDEPELVRFLFLRQASRELLPERDDYSWMDRVIGAAHRYPNAPEAHGGPALERLLAQGCSRSDINEVVRAERWDLFSRFSYLLSDPCFAEAELYEHGWALVECDSDGKVGRVVDALQESVADWDPFKKP